MPKHRPKREPKFHRYEMFEGEGRSTKEELAILKRGCRCRRGSISIFKVYKTFILFKLLVRVF